MKKRIITGLVLTAAVALTGAACQQTTTTVNTNSVTNRNSPNTNSAMNMNGMDHNSMNHNSMPMNSNVSGMDHSEMKSSPDAAQQPYDLQFLDTMAAHHQGAVEMAKVAVEKTQNPELKAFAQKIIADQNKEIAQMKDWREKWYAGKPAAMNMEMAGMADSMKMDMSKLSNAQGRDFDLAFLEMMTPHHAGAITMSQKALTKAEHPEIKTLANQIIKAQEAEIKMMAGWKTKWSK